MRQDWVEFEQVEYTGYNGGCNSKIISAIHLRPEYITTIKETDHGVKITYDSGYNVDYYLLTDPYEQVKQKIIDAEKYDLDSVTVDRFTEEQYKLLLEAVGFYEASCTHTKENIEFAKRLKPLAKLKKDLNMILNGE